VSRGERLSIHPPATRLASAWPPLSTPPHTASLGGAAMERGGLGTQPADPAMKSRTSMLPFATLNINRFRGLRDVELRDLGRFNVLVGLNNSGKTSVLEAIATYARPLRPSEWVDVVRRRDITNSRAVLLEGLQWLFPQPEAGLDRSKPFTGATRVSGTGTFPVREATAKFTELEGFFDDADVDLEAFEDASTETGGLRRGAQLDFSASVANTPSLFDDAREERFHIQLWESGRGPIAQNAGGVSLKVATITPFSHRVQRTEVEGLSEASFANTKPVVLDLMRVFDPDIEDLEILKRARSEPVVYVRHRRFGSAPLSTFGDGMRRALVMGVSLATVSGGILLVDEIESAIHTSALDSTFRWLQQACQDLDVQLFATTHSLEAVDALMAAGKPAEELVVYRLERKDGATRVKRFAPEDLRLLREELGQEIRS
jgi:hypothetical protein